MECPFCDPINTEIRKFYEDPFFRGLYNLRPLVPGHVLVVSKRHINSILKFNAPEKVDFVSFVERCIFLSLKYADTGQFDMILQEGLSAGISVDHFHLHIIPRKSTDQIARSKAEWLAQFNKNEVTSRAITIEETKEAVKKLKGLAEKYKTQIQSF